MKMTAETLKPFLNLPKHSSTTAIKNVRFYSYCVFIVMFCIAISGIEIWNSIRTSELQTEVRELRDALNELKKRIGFDMFDDLEDFENAYDHSEQTLLDRTAIGGTNSLDDDDLIIGDNSEYSDDDDDNDDDDEDDAEMGSGLFDDPLYDNIDEDSMTSDNEANIYEDIKLRKTRSLESVHGVPVIEESYALRRNRTHGPADEIVDNILLKKQLDVEPKMKYDWNNKQKPFHSSADRNTESSKQKPEEIQHTLKPHLRWRTGNPISDVKSRRSRVMTTNKEDKSKAFRQIMTKSEYIKWQESLEPHLRDPPSEKLRIMRHMQKSIEGRERFGRSRPKSVAIHYASDTSRFTAGRHEHYEGNGRLRHVGGTYVDWVPAEWTNTIQMDRYFKMENGIVTVKEGGLYHIYAQIFYHDDHDTNAYLVEHNNQPFLQCTTTSPAVNRMTKSNTCYTAGVTFLKPGDTIHLSDFGSHRYSLFEPAKSFFGLIRIGDNIGRSNVQQQQQSHPQYDLI